MRIRDPLVHGHVVGVTRNAICTERDHHLGLDPLQDVGGGPASFGVVGLE